MARANGSGTREFGFTVTIRWNLKVTTRCGVWDVIYSEQMSKFMCGHTAYEIVDIPNSRVRSACDCGPQSLGINKAIWVALAFPLLMPSHSAPLNSSRRLGFLQPRR
jgi:hypothetical protein